MVAGETSRLGLCHADKYLFDEELSLAATARMIWLCACVRRYWLHREVGTRA